MLDLHLPLMLFVLALFLVLLVLLNTMLFQPLVKFMDDRERSIAKDLEAAKELSSSSDELEKKAQEIIDAAKNEAAKIRQATIEEEKKLATHKAEKKLSELNQSYKIFLEELESEKKKIKNALLSQIPLFKESLKAKFSKL
ncbi:MAG: F0F1 ATP synthase subunit B' [Sulfurovum sp.]|nr:MAG: F0F1 ATP synthase subunit B' [Sulfurovum sp.]